MALTEDSVQSYLGSESSRTFDFQSESEHVGRAWIDGTLVVYDLMDIPLWLATVLEARDEDGNTQLDEPRQAIA